MKALIKGGLCLALGWLTAQVGAQEIPHWHASKPKNTSDTAVIAPDGGQGGSAGANNDAAVRPVSLLRPMPLGTSQDGDATPGVFRFVNDQASPTIRAQAADDKTIPPLPVLGSQDPPRALPKDQGGFPPPPTPYSVMPMTPTFSSVGMGSTDPGSCCSDACACGPRYNLNMGCCPDRGRFWGSAEYLMFWQKGDSVPPLVTASPGGTPLATAGVLGQPTTTVLYDSVPDPMRSGGRFDLGMWFQRCPNLGIEANFLFLGRETDSTTFSSNGDPVLSRPFYNVVTNMPAAQQVANQDPAGVTGSVTVQHYSQFWGVEGDFRYKWCCGPSYYIDLLFGYRHLDLSEGIDINENLTTNTGSTNILLNDSFHTRNEFNGAQFGIDAEWRFANRWSLGTTFKFAMGTTHEIVNIDGSTSVPSLPPPFNATQPGGLLSSPTNIGRYTQDHFAVAPEVALKINYYITENLSVYAGYNFIYLSNVVRPGEQIDTNVNPTFLPFGSNTGTRQPTVLFRTSDYWAQGLTFGLAYRY
jgi:hypothetical protein